MSSRTETSCSVNKIFVQVDNSLLKSHLDQQLHSLKTKGADNTIISHTFRKYLIIRSCNIKLRPLTHFQFLYSKHTLLNLKLI